MNPFSLPFMQNALAASLLAGGALSLLGIFVLTRGVSFSGLAVAQLAALGAVIAAWAGIHLGESAVALILVAGGLFLLAWLARVKRSPPDSWVACLYVLGASAAVLLLSKLPLGESHTMSIFFGNVLSLGAVEVGEALVIFTATILVLALWFRRWIWLFLDPTSAQVAGIAVPRWNALFFCLFAVAMTVGIHVFGVLLALAFLLLPAAGALLAASGLRSLFVFLISSAWISTAAGLYFSFLWDLPAGPFIAFILSILVLALGVFRAVFR